MKTPEEIIRGMNCCHLGKGGVGCGECPYDPNLVPTEERDCAERLHGDVMEFIEKVTKPCEGSQDAPETPQPMTRERILARAKECVCGEREQDYGTPEDSFATIANLWEAYMGVKFTPTNVAVMMALLKVARLKESPKHMDNWIDLAGYAACGGEIADGG